MNPTQRRAKKIIDVYFKERKISQPTSKHAYYPVESLAKQHKIGKQHLTDYLKEEYGVRPLPVHQTVELDCAPGFPRPGHLIGGVIEGTGLPEKESESRIFGKWTWDYSEVDPELWKQARPVLKERIKALFEKGLIRYGSW